MISTPASIVATLRRVLDIPRTVFPPAGHRTEPSRPEHLEALFKVVGQTLGECPSWVLVALEQAERHRVYVAEAEKRKSPC
jgi:hypothetical protein